MENIHVKLLKFGSVVLEMLLKEKVKGQTMHKDRSQ